MSAGRYEVSYGDLDHTLLATALGGAECWQTVAARIDADDFRTAPGRRVWGHALALVRDDHLPDCDRVLARIMAAGPQEIDECGGVEYLSDLVCNGLSVYSAPGLADEVARHSLIRRAADECRRALDEITRDDFDDEYGFVATLESRFAGLIAGRREEQDGRTSLRAHLTAEIADMTRREQEGVRCVPTGYAPLDDKLVAGGFSPGDLVIVGARTSIGKSTFGLNLAFNAARAGHPTLFLTNEQSVEQMRRKLLGGAAEVDGRRILRPAEMTTSEQDRVVATIERIQDRPLFLAAVPGWALSRLRAEVVRHRKEHRIELVVLDYLQLVPPEREGSRSKASREQEVSAVSRGLKLMAQAQGVAVLAFAQLSRGIDKEKKPRRPVLADLRESGALEQDADVVMFLHRPDVMKAEATLIVAKNRACPRLGDIPLVYRPLADRYEAATAATTTGQGLRSA